MDDSFSWSINSNTVLATLLSHGLSGSLVRVGEAVALIDRACLSGKDPSTNYFRTLAFNLAVRLSEAPVSFDADSIAIAMLYRLPDDSNTRSIASKHRVLTHGATQSDQRLLKGLLRFTGLEWNIWPSSESDFVSSPLLFAFRDSLSTATGHLYGHYKIGDVSIKDRLIERDKRANELASLFASEHVSPDWRVPFIKVLERSLLLRMLLERNARQVIPVDAINYALASLSVYSLMAERIGMWFLKTDVEDASLAILDPQGYSTVVEYLDATQPEREKALHKAISLIEHCLSDAGISNVSVSGRNKNIFSIYRKVAAKSLTLQDLNDFAGVRIIIHPVKSDEQHEIELRVVQTEAERSAGEARVQAVKEDPKLRKEAMMKALRRANAAYRAAAKAHASAVRELNANIKENEENAIDTCYKAFAELRERWGPTGDYYEGASLRDWIRRPKENGYQSLHTTLLIEGITVELQMRTEQMHVHAELGMAAHWKYKSESNYGSIQLRIPSE